MTDPAKLDADILDVLREHGRTMTYVVRNVLTMRSYGYDWRALTTTQVRRRLIKLEQQGKVRRVPTGYAVQICWTLVGAA